MEIFIFIFENSSTKDILGRIKEIREFCNCRWILDFYIRGLLNGILKTTPILAAYINKLVPAGFP